LYKRKYPFLVVAACETLAWSVDRRCYCASFVSIASSVEPVTLAHFSHANTFQPRYNVCDTLQLFCHASFCATVLPYIEKLHRKFVIADAMLYIHTGSKQAADASFMQPQQLNLAVSRHRSGPRPRANRPVT